MEYKEQKKDYIFTPEVVAQIKVAHDRFIARLQTTEFPPDAILDSGDTPAERATLTRWATNPGARRADLRKMGALT